MPRMSSEKKGVQLTGRPTDASFALGLNKLANVDG